MKASLGTGMLSIPYVFKLSGLWFGLILTLVTSFICAHCSYIAVKCAHILYKRIKVSSMTYPEVAEAAFANGPKRVRYLAKTARYFVTICTFITYFGACSVYAVIVGKNTKQMVEYYYPGSEIGIRVSILIFLLPLVLLTSIRNLKFLAPVSILANSCMAAGLSITIYYFVRDLPDIRERPFLNDVSGIPAAIPMTVFAIEAIGVIMPLENQMKKPQNFVGIFGVLNQGMAIVTAVFVILGFFGYWCFGNASEDNIVLNLPVDEKKAQAVKILISCAVLLTFSLTLYPAIEITYNAVKDRFEKKQVMANYIVRATLSSSAVLVGFCLPSIGSLIALIGAFGFSTTGLLFPVIIELVTCWESGYGRYNWILYKNIICFAFGLFAFIFGTMAAITDIIHGFF